MIQLQVPHYFMLLHPVYTCFLKRILLIWSLVPVELSVLSTVYTSYLILINSCFDNSLFLLVALGWKAHCLSMCSIHDYLAVQA